MQTHLRRVKKIVRSVSVVATNAIVPFAEKPSEKKYDSTGEENKKGLAASDLFSIFTADIIRQDVVFTR